MNHCLLAVVFYLLSCISNLSAQIGLSIPITSNAQPGTVLNLPVKVTNFDSVIAVQFVLRWDPSVLKFEGVQQFNLPDLDLAEFSVSTAAGLQETIDSGYIRFAWVFYTQAGTTLPDGTHIFYLKLKVTGPINSGTPIRFTELPPLTYFEIVNAANVAFGISQVKTTTGFVAVGYTYVATNDIFSKPVISIFPNPFVEKTALSLDLPRAERLQVSVVEASGRPVFEKTIHAPAGRFGMEIAFDAPVEKGIYFLLIHSASFSHAQPLIANQ